MSNVPGDEAGKVRENRAVYSELVRAVADEYKTPFIDLDRRSQEMLQRFGVENSKLLYVQMESGEHPSYPEGKVDNTHFNEFGTRKNGALGTSQRQIAEARTGRSDCEGKSEVVVGFLLVCFASCPSTGSG